MSLFPIDLDAYREATIEWLYYLLFPYIKADFMGKKDCESVHAEGNMLPVVNNSTGTITHILRGGTDIQASIKEAEYKAKAESGDIKIRTAQDTGRFTG